MVAEPVPERRIWVARNADEHTEVDQGSSMERRINPIDTRACFDYAAYSGCTCHVRLPKFGKISHDTVPMLPDTTDIATCIAVDKVPAILGIGYKIEVTAYYGVTFGRVGDQPVDCANHFFLPISRPAGEEVHIHDA